MFDELFQDQEVTFLKSKAHIKAVEDEKTAKAMIEAMSETEDKDLQNFLSDKRDNLDEGIDKTLKSIQKHAEEILKLNEKLKKELGYYKQIKDSAQDIIWTVEFIEKSQ